jgi:hypothetical protein
MARQYVLTDAELDALVTSLELEKLRLKEPGSNGQQMSIDDIHRRMHFHVVRWVQDVAGKRN